MKSMRAFARRCGTAVALAVIALQLVLSFAHVHTHRAVPMNRGGAASFARAGSGLQVAERLPARLSDEDDYCPICFSGFLLANASLPDAGANAHAPHLAAIELAFTVVSDRVIARRRAAFLSRAPPAA